MNGFHPSTGTDAEWNAAYYRLEDYLRAHGVLGKVHQSQVIIRILERAAVAHKQSPDQSPLTLSLREAYEEMVRWFRRIFPDEKASPARICSVGRLGLYLVNASERWPNVFMEEGELPADFLQAMRGIFVQTGPDLRPSTMTPRVPDTEPEADLFEEAWQKLDQFFSVRLFGLIVAGLALGQPF